MAYTKARVMLSLPKDLAEQLDALAELRGQTRSKLYEIMLRKAYQEEEDKNNFYESVMLDAEDPECSRQSLAKHLIESDKDVKRYVKAMNDKKERQNMTTTTITFSFDPVSGKMTKTVTKE